MKKEMHREKKQSKSPWLVAAVCLVIILAAAGAAVYWMSRNVRAYWHKMELLEGAAFSGQSVLQYGNAPAGSEAGYAVFVSVCDTARRADVYTGTGVDLATAWQNARDAAAAALWQSGMEPVWVKADVVYQSEKVSMEQLGSQLAASRQEFFRYGLAFDDGFGTALLEAELNGAKIYDYDNGGIDFDYLNRYLQKAGRPVLDALPDSCTLFQCKGWLCDENGQIWALADSGLDYGRRTIDKVDASYAAELIRNASDFLVGQIKEDGSFVYGWYPRFDNEIENYNIMRHTSTLWSLICRWRMDPSDELTAVIDRAMDYMLSQVIYDSDGAAYLYEAKSQEIKLGGCGLAVVILTEYMDAFDTDIYEDVCRSLGEGILSMMDLEEGTFYHVLNQYFSHKEEFRTIYYDGEATFGLCRLYGLTGERRWLDAACAAADHFIAADYAQYKDHWIAYAMNELTQYVPTRTEYYIFALQNAQDNLQSIYDRDTTYHTYLELLMSAFEVYDRLVQIGAKIGGFDIDFLLRTIEQRVTRQLNGYFYPEVAMYMENPARILDTFMVRHDGYRVRIDDVQHNIGGYYLYWKNYDRLQEYGLWDG